ncbi:hypothetical protein H7F33_07965 [Pedobacter sp. PAMC26386]|nr:hypothetical protein H7F33_07965 [Pedobacter sp. PAMC26386]
MKLERFHPPGNMTDFNNIPNQLQQWSDAISGWIDGAIQIEQGRLPAGTPVQFFNATKTDPSGQSFIQDIIWNAFPRTLVLAYGKEMAYPKSEQLFSLGDKRPGLPTAPPFFPCPVGSEMWKLWKDLLYRPLDEYCEFRVERDPNTQKILRIIFTSEPPEYWQALHGDELQDANGNFAYKFTGDKNLMLDLYHEYVSKEVKLEDLACKQDYDYMGTDKDGKPVKIQVFRKGDYNPYNMWNSTKGIMHLSHPNNFIQAEIQLGADATILRQKNGKPVVQADALVCCSGYGGTSRSSDPTIGASVNDLARLGAYVTILDPIGLYMHDLNTEGFTKPNGESIDPREYFKVVRGDEAGGMIERAVFEVPAKEGFTVSDLKIGGVPINWGGQVAEHINIKITGNAVGPGTFKNPMLPCATFCCIDVKVSNALTRVSDIGDPIHTGYQETFKNDQGTFGQTLVSDLKDGLSSAVQEAKPYREMSGIPAHKKR